LRSRKVRLREKIAQFLENYPERQDAVDGIALEHGMHSGGWNAFPCSSGGYERLLAVSRAYEQSSGSLGPALLIREERLIRARVGRTAENHLVAVADSLAGLRSELKVVLPNVK
jgi:hypothetical protein